ncbi:MAG: zinc-ribbon domain-containing protein [Bryobacteraceae bacterium]|nr:zinc-ribbon domain-containing protein [Bryobacteraceae bacterium]MCX7604667.1 zinc-ribbon domain-containing protein [Bryobacteraceae bacterium]
MPFCTKCGCQVDEQARFCPACGAPQFEGAAPPPPPPPGASAFAPSGQAAGAGSPRREDFLSRMPSRRAALLCYVPLAGWIMSIVVLASERFREERTVRFHAFQGLYLFVVWLFADWVFGPMTGYAPALRFAGGMLKLAVLGLWVYMMMRVHAGDDVRLPVIGELAERSVAEQK